MDIVAQPGGKIWENITVLMIRELSYTREKCCGQLATGVCSEDSCLRWNSVSLQLHFPTCSYVKNKQKQNKTTKTPPKQTTPQSSAAQLCKVYDFSWSYGNGILICCIISQLLNNTTEESKNKANKQNRNKTLVLTPSVLWIWMTSHIHITTPLRRK